MRRLGLCGLQIRIPNSWNPSTPKTLLAHQGVAVQVALQQRVLQQRHRQQQRREAAGNEGHELGGVRGARRRELREVRLRCLVAGVQPA